MDDQDNLPQNSPKKQKITHSSYEQPSTQAFLLTQPSDDDTKEENTNQIQRKLQQIEQKPNTKDI